MSVPRLRGFAGRRYDHSSRQVCKDADTVHLVSALDLPPSPGSSELDSFMTGEDYRQIECPLWKAFFTVERRR